MSIISNSCVAGYLYREYFKVPYPNPFIWSYIDIKSFVNLISNYNTLNYNNIKIEQTNHLIIDNIVDVHYLHYVKDMSYKKPTYIKGENTIRYNNIEEYILNKYHSRLKRMNVNEPTMFIIGHSYKYLNEDELNFLQHANIMYPCFVYNDICIKNTNPHISLYKCDIKNNNKKLSEYIFNHIKDKMHSKGSLS